MGFRWDHRNKDTRNAFNIADQETANRAIYNKLMLLVNRGLLTPLPPPNWSGKSSVQRRNRSSPATPGSQRGKQQLQQRNRSRQGGVNPDVGGNRRSSASMDQDAAMTAAAWQAPTNTPHQSASASSNAWPQSSEAGCQPQITQCDTLRRSGTSSWWYEKSR